MQHLEQLLVFLLSEAALHFRRMPFFFRRMHGFDPAAAIVALSVMLHNSYMAVTGRLHVKASPLPPAAAIVWRPACLLPDLAAVKHLLADCEHACRCAPSRVTGDSI
jgi:hypothetical protein